MWGERYMLSKNVTSYTKLIKKYDVAGPRYTSYPPVNHLCKTFDLREYELATRQSNVLDDIYGELKPLSLYLHIPFCNTVCYYCGCNKIVTKDKSRANPYLQRLQKEILLQGQLFDPARPVEQLHIGGGTPTFITLTRMQELMNVIAVNFRLRDDDSGEYSIELDPRDIEVDELRHLRNMGFNRLSFGIQDFNEEVQVAVNRKQSTDKIFRLIERARELDFHSINVDLIYGLPKQTAASFRETIDLVILADPDRISIFNYAHLPEIFKPQRRINETELPNSIEKLNILGQFIDQLEDAGYIYIGMDHFAKPDDELARAQVEGRLNRNFQGYSTHADCDLLGLGLTSIGKINNCYIQNTKNIDQYYQLIDNGIVPVVKGLKRSADDLIRGHVIMELMSHNCIDFSKVEEKFAIDFQQYFFKEILQIRDMEQDGLLVIQDDTIRVGVTGQWFIRNICMVFDAYLTLDSDIRYSKVI